MTLIRKSQEVGVSFVLDGTFKGGEVLSIFSKNANGSGRSGGDIVSSVDDESESFFEIRLFGGSVLSRVPRHRVHIIQENCKCRFVCPHVSVPDLQNWHQRKKPEKRSPQITEKDKPHLRRAFKRLRDSSERGTGRARKRRRRNGDVSDGRADAEANVEDAKEDARASSESQNGDGSGNQEDKSSFADRYLRKLSRKRPGKDPRSDTEKVSDDNSADAGESGSSASAEGGKSGNKGGGRNSSTNEATSTSRKRVFAVGDRVEVLWEMEMVYYPGVVESVKENGMYRVLYEDGDIGPNEDPSLMRSYRKDRGKDGHGGEDDDEEEAARKKEARRRRNKERQRQERKKREKRERQISRVTSRRHGRRR